MPDDLYDSDMDSNPRSVAEGDGAEKADKAGYATFLAPKASFAGKDLEVGSVHRVRVERLLDSEVELRCGEDGDEDKDEAEPVEVEANPLYD